MLEDPLPIISYEPCDTVALLSVMCHVFQLLEVSLLIKCPNLKHRLVARKGREISQGMSRSFYFFTG